MSNIISHLKNIIQITARSVDTYEGHDELPSSNKDKHEVLDKSKKELSRIYKFFGNDDEKYSQQLRKYLIVVNSDLKASIGEYNNTKNVDKLHKIYEEKKDRYFLGFPDPNYKKNH